MYEESPQISLDCAEYVCLNERELRGEPSRKRSGIALRMTPKTEVSTVNKLDEQVFSITFMGHYQIERNHQGLGNRLIAPELCPLMTDEPVQRRKRLGGLLNYYHRAARSFSYLANAN